MPCCAPRAGPELLIAATDVSTGRPRLFRRAEITVEAVLASACLPTLHHAVSIDGQAYWDGGFSANPDLLTLGRESPVGDTLIVKLNAVGARRRADERARDHGPHQPDHLQPADAARHRGDRDRARAHGRWTRASSPADARLARHRFHLIDAGRFTSSLTPESKGKPDIELLTYLHDAGRSETEKWLARHRRKHRLEEHGRPGAALPGAALARHLLAASRSRPLRRPLSARSGLRAFHRSGRGKLPPGLGADSTCRAQ